MTGSETTVHKQILHMDGYDIEVTRKRVKNINLRIRPDGSVAVSAPKRVTLAEIEQLVQARSSWIDRHRARTTERASQAQRSWISGEYIGLWGTPTMLQFIFDETARAEYVEHIGNTLYIHMAPRWHAASAEAQRYRRKAVDRWLKKQLERAVSELRGPCEARVGQTATQIRYRRMTSRWGSCNIKNGHITLNIELAERPLECLEAVLCHELCHLHERLHNQRFYAYLDAACPNWRTAHQLLDDRAPSR